MKSNKVQVMWPCRLDWYIVCVNECARTELLRIPGERETKRDVKNKNYRKDRGGREAAKKRGPDLKRVSGELGEEGRLPGFVGIVIFCICRSCHYLHLYRSNAIPI